MTPGNLVYHVLNRANARICIFQKDEDYLAFERVVEEALEQVSMRILAYAVMPNHWHMVLWLDEARGVRAIEYTGLHGRVTQGLIFRTSRAKPSHTKSSKYC